MPTINQQQAGDPVEILADYVQRDGWGINPATTSPTNFSFVDMTPPTTLGSMSVTGTGFTYFTVNGETVPISGTVTSLKINSGIIIIGQPPYVPLEITGLDLSVTQLLLAAQDGEDAVRDLFANLQWTWTGSTGNDSFTGGNLNDHLTGNDGNDVIRGGNGSDTIIGDDGMPASDGNDTLYGDGGNDFIYGYGGKDILHGGTGEDYVSGGSEDDVLYGNEDNDRLFGQSGNDTLDGGTDSDSMEGGAGADKYYVDNVGDKVIEGNVAGIDVVSASVSFATGGQHIENVLLTGWGNINATGNALANYLVGNSANNSLDGGAGADTLQGGAGNDKYYVDNVGDKVIEGNVAGIDVVSSSVSFAAGGQYIENILLTGSASINATGNTLNNYLVGNNGANIISGGVGNDLLTGGAGRDAFVFNTAANSSTNRDTISDFSVADDTIWMENAIFTALGAAGPLAAAAFHIGTAAADASDRIIYNSTTGALIYDSNGTAAGGATQFATLSTGLALTNADFLVI
ncbi:calcium-binding protein [Phyllobacterium sp. YR531]|uniref:calcium-binding protein n=1 Tax=Phyllobacterium sp. YR531 TaxID=1144343 RepID=UPI00026FBB96|nr:calcium-binding protein [Phyllobacterium sp. YR531]EJM98155.1 putative calcium-binding protein [Phyllobacterium sp. YR531]